MPLIDAFRAGVDLANAQQQGLITAANAKYALPMNRADLAGKGLANIHADQQNQVYLPDAWSQIASRKSSTRSQDIDNQFAPDRLKLANEHQAQINKLYPEIERADINYKNSGGSRGATNSKIQLQRNLEDNIARDNPNIGNDPSRIREAVNALLSGKNTLSDGTRLNELSPETTGALNMWTLGQNTAQGNNQINFAATLEDIFKKSDANAKQAFQFSGAAGKVKGGFESLIAQSGENDPYYLAYQKFTGEDIPAMVTEIVRTSGAHSTDSQKAMAIQQALTIDLKTNPKAAEAKYEELKKLYRGIGKSIRRGVGVNSLRLGQDSNAPEAPETQPAQSPMQNSQPKVRTYNLATGSFE